MLYRREWIQLIYYMQNILEGSTKFYFYWLTEQLTKKGNFSSVLEAASRIAKLQQREFEST